MFNMRKHQFTGGTKNVSTKLQGHKRLTILTLPLDSVWNWMKMMIGNREEEEERESERDDFMINQ